MPSVYEKEDGKVYDDETRQNLSNRESSAGIHDDNIPDSGKKFDYSKSLGALENKGGGDKKGKGDDNLSTAKDAAGAAAAFASGNGLKGVMQAAKLVGKKKKKGIIGGIIAIAIVGLLTLGLFMTLPLKILSITTNLQNIFFSSAEDAANRMDDNILRHYLIKKVVPGMVTGKCTTTRVAKSCAAVSDGGNVVTQMYRAWRDANLEGKLATDYGIEIRREGSRFFMRTPASTAEIDLGNYDINNPDTFDNRAFQRMSRSEVRSTMRSAFKTETFARGLFYNRSVGKMLERKYGIRRCVIACEIRDNFTDKVELKKRAALLRFTERVIQPHSLAMSLAIECGMNGFDCAQLRAADPEGEKLTEYEANLRTKLIEMRGTYDKTLEEVDADSKEIQKLGFGNYIIKKVAGETAAKLTTRGIPVAGWILLVADATNSSAKAGPAIKAIRYTMRVTAAVQFYSMMRTASDEIKPGNIDAETLGSFATMYDSGAGKDQGGASLESSPAYQQQVIKADMSGPGSASLINAVSPKAYAANDVPLCNDNKPYPQGKLSCPELTGEDTDAVGVLTDWLGRAMALNAIGNYNAGLIVKLVDFLADVLTPAWVDRVMEIIADVLEPVFRWAIDYVQGIIFPSWVTANPGGSRAGEASMLGANAAGNDACHLRQGCKVGSTTDIAQARERVEQDRAEEFAALPLKARLFSTDESKSFVSKLAMAMPTQDGTLGSFASSMVRGFANLTYQGLASAVSPQAAEAYEVKNTPGYNPKDKLSPDPFGITQYFYPTDEPAFIADPEAFFTEKDCENPDNLRIWGDKATAVNENTGQAEQHETNPCMLIRERVSSTGGFYDTGLLLPDNEAGVAAPPGGGIGSADGWTFPLITTKSAIKAWRPGPWCYDQQTNCHHTYPAADLMIGRGTTVVAAKPGTILTKRNTTAACTGALGGYPTIQIKGDDGNYYFYAHFEPGKVTAKNRGDHVDAGERLGEVGYDKCGQSSSHLHIQMYTSVINGNAQSMNIQPGLVKAFEALPE